MWRHPHANEGYYGTLAVVIRTMTTGCPLDLDKDKRESDPEPLQSRRGFPGYQRIPTSMTRLVAHNRSIG